MQNKLYLKCLLLFGLVLSSAASLFTVSASAASDEGWQIEPAFTDKQTGRDYYNARTWRNGSMEGRVLFVDKEGSWRALPEKYVDIFPDERSGKFYLGQNRMQKGLITNVYDPSTDRVTSQRVYESSPDGKYGISLEKFYLTSQLRNNYTLYIKNMQTGESRKWHETLKSMWYLWLPDNRLLVQWYSESEKQSEIVILNPATDKVERVALAKMEAYDAKGNRLLISYNEPTRKSYVLNLANRRVHKAGQAEIESFYKNTEPLPVTKMVVPPKREPNIDPAEIPAIEVEEETVYEASITVDGRAILLPYAYTDVNNNTWLPLTPLAESLGGKVEKEKSSGFQLDVGGKKYTLNESNSEVAFDRLHVSIKALRQFGLPVEQFRWITPNH